MKDLFPPDPDGLLELHNRKYEVRAWRMSNDKLLLRGAVRDDKPSGLYLEQDAEPLTIHHMIVDLEVDFPSMDIKRVEVVFESHPHQQCTGIINTYQSLVGISIARGFTNKVKELFGGPRGCTHVGALLNAMAPVAIQCAWSMRVAAMRETGDTSEIRPRTPEEFDKALKFNINTCHVWEEDGETVNFVRNGGDLGPPLPVQKRLDELGLGEEAWKKMRG